MKIKKSSLIIRIVIVALILYAGISLVGLKSQTQNAEERRAELQQQVDAAVQENEELQYAIKHSTDPEIIEDVARNDIGLVKPGEKLFYDVSD
ncbi:MAG: septum formation initiator family protein [Clostridiales bacterium]|jgi:cell division protein DivIC|nr:septum formation initiator family protein [Clostridiales bacterium]